MYIRFIIVALVVLALLQDANGKKSKKKRINNDSSESTPQPNVLTYSNFGFNDVGSYSGFVPTSPDYANYLTKSQESSTRLYAPAFPSALDATGLGSYYDPQPDTGSFNPNSAINGNDHLNQEVSLNFFTSPNRDLNNNEGKDSRNTDDADSPKYGTKLNSKSKNKYFNNFNNTEYNIFDSVSSVINGDAVRNQNVYSNYASLPSAPPSIENDKIVAMPPSSLSALKFPKYVDFTDVKNYYPTSVESKYQESMQKPIVIEPIRNHEGDVTFHSFQENNNKDHNIEQSYKNKFHLANEYKQDKEKNSFGTDEEVNSYTKQKNNPKTNRFKTDLKDKVKEKNKPWNAANYNSDTNIRVRNPTNGYGYSTNFSSTNFKFDYEEHKRPLNSSIDEISPASSNLDFVNYQSPDKEFSAFKNIQNFNSFDFDGQDTFSQDTFRDKYKPSEDYLNSFKNFHSVPTTTSHWGNIFNNAEYSSYRHHPIKPYFDDDSTDDIVHIPKRQKNKYGRYTDIKFDDVSLSNVYKPYKVNDVKQELNWPKDFFNTRFKSEEDLLGLRNHDTSYPYHSASKPSYNDLAEEVDYKKLTQKWKQNYLRSKYRDSNREYESYASETKPTHVPLPKPYTIEVPHPVIVPVPQPYPVKVPIPKPVAVPVIRELTVPVEKPMPYPVIKKVPYPIVKPVPVPVEKQVHVPVIKPYPVHIPKIRPVFHHTKPQDDEDVEFEEDEYVPRPDTKKPVYKRLKNSPNRPRPSSRRPSRMTYQDRNRKRAPAKRPGHYDQRPRRPYHTDHRPQKYQDFEEYDSDSEFDNYCKKTGRC